MIVEKDGEQSLQYVLLFITNGIKKEWIGTVDGEVDIMIVESIYTVGCCSLQIHLQMRYKVYCIVYTCQLKVWRRGEGQNKYSKGSKECTVHCIMYIVLQVHSIFENLQLSQHYSSRNCNKRNDSCEIGLFSDGSTVWIHIIQTGCKLYNVHKLLITVYSALYKQGWDQLNGRRVYSVG